MHVYFPFIRPHYFLPLKAHAKKNPSIQRDVVADVQNGSWCGSYSCLGGLLRFFWDKPNLAFFSHKHHHSITSVSGLIQPCDVKLKVRRCKKTYCIFFQPLIFKGHVSFREGNSCPHFCRNSVRISLNPLPRHTIAVALHLYIQYILKTISHCKISFQEILWAITV